MCSDMARTLSRMRDGFWNLRFEHPGRVYFIWLWKNVWKCVFDEAPEMKTQRFSSFEENYKITNSKQWNCKIININEETRLKFEHDFRSSLEDAGPDGHDIDTLTHYRNNNDCVWDFFTHSLHIVCIELTIVESQFCSFSSISVEKICVIQSFFTTLLNSVVSARLAFPSV